MVQVLSLTLTSQADNPLPRVVLSKDLYRKALSASLTRQPGSEMEDRQYQLDITGVLANFIGYIGKRGFHMVGTTHIPITEISPLSVNIQSLNNKMKLILKETKNI